MSSTNYKIAVLLVGGHSSRMGTDKFAMNINGKLQWEFMVEELGTFFDNVYISCRPDQAKHFDGHDLILDRLENIGPMGAIFSSFRLFESRYPTPHFIFFVACDLPRFDVSLAKKLSGELASGYNVIAPRNPDRDSPEPLIAFWSSTALPKLEAFIAQDNYALHKCMSQLRVKTVSIEDPSTLQNVNRPEDL